MTDNGTIRRRLDKNRMFLPSFLTPVSDSAFWSHDKSKVSFVVDSSLGTLIDCESELIVDPGTTIEVPRVESKDSVFTFKGWNICNAPELVSPGARIVIPEGEFILTAEFETAKSFEYRQKIVDIKKNDQSTYSYWIEERKQHGDEISGLDVFDGIRCGLNDVDITSHAEESGIPASRISELAQAGDIFVILRVDTGVASRLCYNFSLNTNYGPFTTPSWQMYNWGPAVPPHKTYLTSGESVKNELHPSIGQTNDKILVNFKINKSSDLGGGVLSDVDTGHMHTPVTIFQLPYAKYSTGYAEEYIPFSPQVYLKEQQTSMCCKYPWLLNKANPDGTSYTTFVAVKMPEDMKLSFNFTTCDGNYSGIREHRDYTDSPWIDSLVYSVKIYGFVVKRQ